MAPTLADRFYVKIGVGTWSDNQSILWRHYNAWDYAQTNDDDIWDSDPRIDELIDADRLIEDDPVAGFEKYLDLAEGGSTWAMGKVGYRFYNGIGVARHAERAEYCYRRGYEAGSTRAMLDLGKVLAARGDIIGAEEVFSRGAADDWGPALFWLAWYRMKRRLGRGRDQTLALLERAATKGSPAAKWILARSLSRGRFGIGGVPRGLKLMWASNAERFAVVERHRAEANHPA